MNKEFDDIRAYGPEDLPEAYERLTADPQFKAVVEKVFPHVPFEALSAKLKQCKTNLDFQVTFCYPFLKDLLSKASTGCDIDITNIDINRRYTFVSNHRDIVLDSALLDVMLIDSGFKTTCEIAIGDNLLAAPWIKDLVRVNKSFIVLRSAGIREMLTNSKRMSEYMHLVINEKNDNIWIAQREGRAKDSDDRTQEAILKMMAMGGEGSATERLRQLHIVPLSISYEYDPCDYLKAAEFQLKRDIEGWKKSKQDDVLSMQTGIMGFKGAIHYHCAPAIDDYLEQIPADTPKGDIFKVVASHIDKCIHSNYRLYPNNLAALDILEGTSHGGYSESEKATFEQYIAKQLSKTVDMLNKLGITPDKPFLRERMLTMYANPARNKKNIENP
ncbi:1-acyl-sn-glycerol-3-phosphate acyltransferase [Prevotella sp. P2-180]|uniref:1-acyl-sn-glycerol-3-phosphate acyltransferase n=1 Tax=Prevotella sp. P2-180 TaxID=2024224 RepID=UPI000B968104|nr:1-acyl-sn-glycerol-3-phosphate acyltransferase [Prevotella sp. P2-180]MDD5784996.1 1-acyl-sn-glycerol-3-phosphate acyltransferase [Prevotella sp.]MDD6862716.1 1-acyl-sn-glycerol-3-phosphate acyltransferase [Prevotella sp.]MDD7226605.1 1-acyl-sn-glycerol-3-phosphate acyltransferase [Prevotella sp.]MDY4498413.1 1-acyl-sn-glycerol-3-phosphate acyltransferase [Prevotella sp.]OYP67842.1 acyltransferase [Prevotella sp. P2-180]